MDPLKSIHRAVDPSLPMRRLEVAKSQPVLRPSRNLKSWHFGSHDQHGHRFLEELNPIDTDKFLLWWNQKTKELQLSGGMVDLSLC